MRILPHWPSDTSTFSASTGDLVRDVPLQKATKFDSRKTYLPKEKGADFFDDGHEIGLLHFIYSHKNLHKMRGSPKHVVAAMDENGRKKNYLMNVGKNKGRVVTELIAEVEPKVMVELGGYVGYSCILFGDSLRKAGGYRYYSIEMNPEFAAVIMSLVDPAGLSDIVTVIVGDAWPSLLQLYVGGVRQIDLLFLDHYKPAYASDLKLAEDYGFIKPGSVVVANDVVKRGTNSPAYLFWVRSGMRPKWKIVLGKADLEKTCAKEHGTAMKQYGKKCGISKMTQSTGDPGLVYEGGLVESFEPTGKLSGLEISRCVYKADPRSPLDSIAFSDLM